jgi:ubiquinol-cytochrome c reductase cytochrome b subunit
MSVLGPLVTWLEDRTGLVSRVGALARHRVPPDARWLYVFGSAVLFAFLLQVVTGIALAFVYVSSTGGAYQSLREITEAVPWGRVLRGMHFFGASAMIALLGVHLVRVFLTGAYKFPREVSWLSGVVLLLLTLAMGFSGQVLRWDQNAVWSLVVAGEQAGRVPVIGEFLAHLTLGGRTLGADTLSRFFAIHVFIIPGLIAAIVGLHLYLVLRNGISEPPRAERPVDPTSYRSWYQKMLEQRGVPFWPDAAWRDALFGSLVIAGVVVLAVVFGPPALDRAPDPSNVQAQPRPDWYFLFYFALLALMPHSLESVAMIVAPLLVFAALLLVPILSHKGQRSPARRPWAMMTVIGTITILAALTVAGERADWSPSFSTPPLPASAILSAKPIAAEGAGLFYERGCLYCHTVADIGGKRGPDLTFVGRRLTRDEMIIRVLNGGYNMPAYGAILPPDQLDALVAFLESRR